MWVKGVSLVARRFQEGEREGERYGFPLANTCNRRHFEGPIGPLSYKIARLSVEFERVRLALPVSKSRSPKIDDSHTLLLKSEPAARVFEDRTLKIGDSCTLLSKNKPGARVLDVPGLKSV